MPEFVFWYDETTTKKAWFEADSKEQAIELLQQAQAGKIYLDELPNYGEKEKGYDSMIGYDTLKEVS
jgi:hypothetical protein